MTPQNATRVGPVYFQPLEQELSSVAQYLYGHLLNAGCGSRNINNYLLANAATKITNYDIASDDPDVIVGPLEAMPFEDGTFDSVLCNAVLEHVVDAEEAIRELARVVKPNGRIVVAVPFLQPFHACPTDFRRYTADGLTALGRRAGLDIVCVLPVHSIAQTLGWIIWEYAQEKGGRIRRSVAWALAFVATRLWNRTDPTVFKNANTFQAVFRRPSQFLIESLGLHGLAARHHAPVPQGRLEVPLLDVGAHFDVAADPQPTRDARVLADDADAGRVAPSALLG